MGAGGSNCAQLKKIENACEMANCIKAVKGQSSNSVSPTDTWILKFKDGTRYEDEPIKRAFLKYWVEVKTLSPQIENFGVMEKRLKGLNYEMSVYSEVIRKLLDFKVNCHFVRYLGRGKSCTFDQLLRMLTAAEGFKSVEQWRNKLIRNVIYISSAKNERPAVDDEDGDTFAFSEQDSETVVSQFRYRLLVTEKSQTRLKDFLANQPRTPECFLKLFFQVATACYAMELSKLTHNDLHLGNVMVDTLPEGEENLFVYYIDSKVYAFRSRHVAKVYDFDRAYVERFPHNPILKKNRTIPNFDVVKFAYLLFRKTSRSFTRDKRKTSKSFTRDKSSTFSVRDVILDAVSHPSKKEFASDVFRDAKSSKDFKKFSETQFFENFNPTNTVLDKIYQSLSQMGSTLFLTEVNALGSDKNVITNFCNPSMFDSNGALDSYAKVHVASLPPDKRNEFEAEILFKMRQRAIGNDSRDSGFVSAPSSSQASPSFDDLGSSEKTVYVSDGIDEEVHEGPATKKTKVEKCYEQQRLNSDDLKCDEELSPLVD